MSEVLRGIALRGLMSAAGCKRVTFDGITADDFADTWEQIPATTRAGWIRAATMLSRCTQQFAEPAS